MKEVRLHAENNTGDVQPKPSIQEIMKANPTLSMSVKKRLAVQAGIEFDAEGNPILEP